MGAVTPPDGFGTEDEDEDEGKGRGRGKGEIVLEIVLVFAIWGFGCTNSDRQTPRLGMTLADPGQLAETQDPARRT